MQNKSKGAPQRDAPWIEGVSYKVDIMRSPCFRITVLGPEPDHLLRLWKISRGCVTYTSVHHDSLSDLNITLVKNLASPHTHFAIVN